MSKKSLVCLNIAIVGRGKMTDNLAQSFANAGHNVFVGQKKQETIRSKKFDNISYTTVESAAIVSDVVIITAPMDEVREVAYMLDDVRRKVIIDATSINLSRFGQHVNTVEVLRSITHCQHIVKCYSKTGYEDLVDENLDDSTAIDLFMASDSKKSKELVKLLAKDICIGQCYDFGEGDMIATLDEMARCYGNQRINENAVAPVLNAEDNQL